jgi:lipopolysaccharide biosynthesis glycosyltransferase
MKKILVTFVIGDRYKTLWNKLCKKSWEHYCEKNKYELVVIDQKLDNCWGGVDRHLVWQKILLPNYYDPDDKILFLDADIIISRDAKDPMNLLKEGMIGAVHEYPTRAHNRQVRHWAGKNAIKSAAEMHMRWGKLETDVPYMVNTGMLCFECKHALEPFKYVWDNFGNLPYEQPPLSHHLQKNNLWQSMPEEFNHIWWNERVSYPFMVKVDKIRLNKNFLKRVPGVMKVANALRFHAILNLLGRTSFLHFNPSSTFDLPLDWWERHLEFEKAGDF